MEIRVTFAADDRTLELLKAILEHEIRTDRRLAALTEKVDELMTVTTEVRALTARIDEATNAIGARLQALADRLEGDISAADAALIKADLEAEATRLEAMGRDPANPIPPEPPMPTPGG